MKTNLFAKLAVEISCKFHNKAGVVRVKEKNVRTKIVLIETRRAHDDEAGELRDISRHRMLLGMLVSARANKTFSLSAAVSVWRGSFTERPLAEKPRFLLWGARPHVAASSSCTAPAGTPLPTSESTTKTLAILFAILSRSLILHSLAFVGFAAI